MKKLLQKYSHKQRIVAAVATIVLLCTLALAAVGNYFVDYALLRKPIEYDDPRSPSYEKSAEEQAVEQAQADAVAAWLAASPYDSVEITTEEGYTLLGHLNTAEQESHRWVIAVHGYTSYYTSVEDIGYAYWQEGYHVLLPELRAHGNSEGEYIGMGYYDSVDMLSWIDLILALDPEAEIVLHGVSMGAATVLCTAGQETLPENVVAVVEDCGYTSAYQMMVEQLDYRFGLPEFPIMPAANLVAQIKAGYNLKEANPLDALETAEVPILFIHGDADTYVLPYMLDILYDSYTGEKQKLVVEGAEHAAARDVAPELYYSSVFSFLAEVS